jgi:hypothetical protein
MRPQTEAEANEAEEAREHLRVLCDVIKTYLQPQLQLQQGLTADVPKVSFDDLWYLYKPGYEIRTSGSKQIQLQVHRLPSSSRHFLEVTRYVLSG